MKTRKLALAAGAFAGLAALPLTTASAAGTTNLPSGSASAEALHVQLSLLPLKSIGGGLVYSQLTSALSNLQSTLCGNATTGCSPLGLTLPTSLPDSLSVDVAQAEDAASLNAVASDLTGGHADSTPVATDWVALNANLAALQDLISGFINQGTAALATGNVDALTNLLSLNKGTLTANVPVLGTATFNLLGTVSASLPGNDHSTATAVQITGNTTGPAAAATQGLNVTVDPFSACAVDAAHVSDCGGASIAQTSAANTLETLNLPDLVGTQLNLTNLSSLANELKSVLNALTATLANPSQAGSILDNVTGVPAPVQSTLGTLGGLLSTAGTTASATGGTTGSVSSALTAALSQYVDQLSAILDSLHLALNAMTNLGLPDLTKAITSTADIATAKTVPVVGGGVDSVATSTLGAVDVLPIGSILGGPSSPLNTALAALKLSAVTPSTALLSVKGITASAEASVGPNGHQVGTAGLQSVSVLGQTIDLDSLAGKAGLGMGQEWSHVFTFPGLGADGAAGSLTLDITRGLPQVVSDTDTFREVRIAALDIRLINGAAGCVAGSQTCSDPLAVSLPASTSAKTAGTNSGASTGISQLGPDGNLIEIGAPMADAAAAMNGSANPCVGPCGGCTTGCSHTQLTTTSAANLPTTGMFGGGALPAGLLLIAVAISLRLLPSLRFLPRRVR